MYSSHLILNYSKGQTVAISLIMLNLRGKFTPKTQIVFSDLFISVRKDLGSNFCQNDQTAYCVSTRNKVKLVVGLEELHLFCALKLLRLTISGGFN